MSPRISTYVLTMDSSLPCISLIASFRQNNLIAWKGRPRCLHLKTKRALNSLLLLLLLLLNRLIAKIDTIGSADTRYGVGMPRTSRTTQNDCAVEAHILSQEDRPGTHRTIPRKSRETDINFRDGNDVIIYSD